MARLEVESAAAARAGKAAERERGERLVEADMCRLEVRRLRTLLGRLVLRDRAGGALGRRRACRDIQCVCFTPMAAQDVGCVMLAVSSPTHWDLHASAGAASQASPPTHTHAPAQPPPLRFSILCSKSGEVVGLEARKRSLEAGMQERRAEVGMQLELMQVSMRSNAQRAEAAQNRGLLSGPQKVACPAFRLLARLKCVKVKPRVPGEEV